MSLTYDDAVSTARAFLDAERVPSPEYRYVLTTGRPIAEGWYFDFKLERVDGDALRDPRDLFGGAPGYKVLAVNGEVQIVGWQEYHRLNMTKE
ncbi:MAG: hypothetical protein ACJ8C4_21065 [Gemmataceae bacterium]